MTTSDRGSLLALDVFANEESLRVHIYKCAAAFPGKSTKYKTTDSVASAFLEFVEGVGWRLDALTAVLEQVGRNATVDSVLERAQEIVDWVVSEPAAVADAKTPSAITDQPATTKPVKKVGATKK
jgi:hypothetical protein